MAKVEVGLASFNIALTTFGSANKWDVALACLKRIPKPDSINVATVVLAMGEARQWRQAVGLLEDDLDVSVANAAITACDKGGQWRQGLLIFQQLLGRWKADDSWQRYSMLLY